MAAADKTSTITATTTMVIEIIATANSYIDYVSVSFE